MSVQYDAPGSQSQVREEFDFSDREAIVKCIGFSRSQDGALVVKDRLGYGLQQVGEQIVDTLNGDAIVRDSDAWERVVYYQFEIVAYQDQDGSPGHEHVGKSLPYTSKLKGITTYKDDEGKWWFKMPGLGLADAQFRTGLFTIAEKCGFDVQALNVGSALYSPEYIADEVAKLESPITPEDILTRIVEPKLLAAAENGLLLKVHTGPNSNWVQWGSITPLTPEQAARYHEAQASSSAKSEELRDKLRGMAKDAPEDFADRVLALALEVQPGVARDSILEQLAASTMEHVIERLSEPESPQQAPQL